MIAAKKKGSFTVEAALIMPVILGITVLFIKAALLCYDRCIMEYICRTACIHAVYEKEPEEAAGEFITGRLSEELVLDWDITVDTGSDGQCITARITASGPIFDRVFEHRAKACKHFRPKY